MKNFVSWGPIFPGEVNTAHMENERLSLKNMLLATKIYTLYLAREASGRTTRDISSMTSIEKALHLLSLFAEEPYEYTFAEVVKITGMNRTTAYRNIATLERAGLLMKDENKKTYVLGPTTYKMGNIYLANGDDKVNTVRLLEEIAKKTKVSVGLARRERDQVMSIYAIESNESIRMNDRPGTLYPMNKGAYGKCLMAYHENPITSEALERQVFEKTAPGTLTKPDDILAEYEAIRKQGYVLSIEETFPSIIGVGVPLRGHDGRVRNVVAVSFFKQDDYTEKIERMKKILLSYKPELEKFMR
jgi:DNA-binding IclR family transcriptional regulator